MSDTSILEYNRRLLHVADYLESDALKAHKQNVLRECNFVHLHEGYEMTYVILYHYWVIEKLPELFDEFFYDMEGDVSFETVDDVVDHVSGIYIYFGLETHDSFCALFDAEGNQFPEQFNTKPLDAHSTPKEIAYNIRQFVKSRTTNQ